MAAQILAGSKGIYKPIHPESGDKTFVTTHDTCDTLSFVVGRFIDRNVDVRIDKSRITWTDLKTSDFQGA